MRRVRGAIVAVGFALALWATPAGAQRTGGSMGGGSFHSSGGGGSSSGGSYSGGGSYSSSSGGSSYSSSGTYSSSGGDVGGDGCDENFGVVVAFFIGFVIIVVSRIPAPGSGGSAPGSSESAPGRPLDVTCLRLAIDWRARRFVQAELSRIAASADTGTPAGLSAMLSRVALALRHCRESWLYAGFADTTPQSPDRAESYFNQLVADAKARFHDELVRNEDGSVTTADATVTLRPRPEEGEGLVVITLVVAAEGPLRDHHDATNAEEIRGWLEGAGAIGQRLVAVQIIWSPADENDRMSSAELEVLYPELKRVRGSTLAGRVYCGHCGAPYPAELQACPQCGGKAMEGAIV